MADRFLLIAEGGLFHWHLFQKILKAFGILQLTWKESQSLESLLVLPALL